MSYGLAGSLTTRSAAQSPRRGKVVVARLGEDLRDGCLIGLGGRGAERECDLARSELEQAIAAAGLAVIIALGVARAMISIWRSLRPKRR